MTGHVLTVALASLFRAAHDAPPVQVLPVVPPALVEPGAPPFGLAGDTVRYLVSNHGRRAGTMTVVRTGDSIEVRYGHIDRNRGRWAFARYRLDAQGRVVAGSAGPMSRTWELQEAEERFPAEDGEDVLPFLRRFATPFEEARVARDLLARPEGWTPPGADEAWHAEVVAEVQAPVRGGVESVRLVMVHRGGGTPSGVWLDPRGELFASEVAWFITVRPDAEEALPALRQAEIAYREREAEALAESLAPPVVEAVVLRGGDVFDAETGTVLSSHTVVVEGDRIVAVGPAGEIAEPEGARVLDVAGKTVMPGMWDMHSHSFLTSQNMGAPLQLAHGLTTVRDLAADLDVAVSLRDRAETGEILSPRQLLAGFMEGPGLWAGPTGVLVRTEEEARQWVAAYDSMGYRQIKLYNLIHPDLLPTIADEAQARGLRLSGHVPRGMSVEAAVELGYDEINHAAFLFSTFFPDSLYVPEMRPYSGVAAVVAPAFDVDGPEMTGLLGFLADHGTVLDGTFNIWMGGRELLEGEGSPAARSYARLLKRVYDEGVTLVPGTDNMTGSTFLTELLLYEHVGIPAPEVLRLATLVPARVMGDDGDYGSVSVGKVADLLVVDGRPHERIADLENLDWVIRAGRVYDPEAIRQAVREGR